ncbi:MAG TPA: hypothetical protein VL135_01255, partial [Terracidiphilus sp.]|nr:hypothetical protein [Terracidiphilus sp.]
MVKERPRNHFTIGIVDDVSHTSLPWDPAFHTEADDVASSLFYGLGADLFGQQPLQLRIIEADQLQIEFFLLQGRQLQS